MALSLIRLCGCMLFLVLLEIQYLYLCWTYLTVIHKQYAWTIAVLLGLAMVVIGVCCTYELILRDSQRRHLSNRLPEWQDYTRFVLGPSFITAFGLQAGLVGKEPTCCCLPDCINVPLCITPILLILLLTTADDSFSSKSHKELVRNLSVLMVADLFDAIEMLNNAFESSFKAFDVSFIFLVIGAITTVNVSSSQMAEYEFIESLEGESEEQIRYKPDVSRKIAELVINVVVLAIRLKALIEHGKNRSTVIIFKNFIAIILSVMHICSLEHLCTCHKPRKPLTLSYSNMDMSQVVTRIFVATN